MKLTYFGIPGRAEASRLMLGVKKVPFTDAKVTREQWPEVKKRTKFGQLPILELEDGRQLAQSSAIVRYVAQQTKFYPSDPWHLALSDEALALTEDITGALRPAFLMQDAEERAAKFKELIDTTFKAKAQLLANALTAQPGPYITGASPTFADFHVFSYIAQFMAGPFGIPADLWDAHPDVLKFRDTMAARKDVQAYFAAQSDDSEYRDQRKGFM